MIFSFKFDVYDYFFFRNFLMKLVILGIWIPIWNIISEKVQIKRFMYRIDDSKLHVMLFIYLQKFQYCNLNIVAVA